MPDQRRHRGPHPEDHELFSAENVPRLRTAVGELSWLLSRGYASPSSLKLVGDRHGLRERQRIAVARCACSDEQLASRRARQVADVRGRALWIDGYNVLTSLEAALGSGVLLLGRDGCCRDMASMHGTYRKMAETEPALELAERFLTGLGPSHVVWLFDQPVSNSGRLKRFMEQLSAERGWGWSVQLHADPDRALRESTDCMATADSAVLDAGGDWLNLVRTLLGELEQPLWMCDLGDT